MNEFAFKLGQSVTLVITNDVGIVMGIAQYLDRATEYGVEYQDSEGKYAYGWFTPRQLEALA